MPADIEITQKNSLWRMFFPKKTIYTLPDGNHTLADLSKSCPEVPWRTLFKGTSVLNITDSHMTAIMSTGRERQYHPLFGVQYGDQKRIIQFHLPSKPRRRSIFG